MNEGVVQAGAIAGVVGLAFLAVGTGRVVRIAGLVAWAAGGALLAWQLAPEGHRGLLAGAGLVALVLAAALAALLVRLPWLLPFLVLAALPARIGVTLGDAHGHLLLPLFLVAAAAALALFWQLTGDDVRGRELGLVAPPLALLAVWCGLSLLWADDPRRGAVLTAFAILPFGLLAVALARVPWDRRWVVALGVQLVAMGVLFALVGIGEWLARDVTWRPVRLTPDATVSAFRADSLFWAPPPYSRFLVLAILAGVAFATARPSRGSAVALACAIAVTWLGLVVAGSPAALVALIAGAVLAGRLVWRRAWVVAVALLAAAAVAVSLAPAARHAVSSRWDDATRGRTRLVAHELRTWRDHPLAGVGLGTAAARSGASQQDPWRTTPVALAADTGAVGVLLLAWLLAEALRGSFRRARTTFAGRTAAACGIMLTAIVVHSLFVDTLLEDVSFWALVALLASSRRVRERVA